MIIYEFRPFQLLKLLRDGVITTMMDIRGGDSLISMSINRFIKGLSNIGLIKYAPKTAFREQWNVKPS
jgi:hypothetical protein